MESPFYTCSFLNTTDPNGVAHQRLRYQIKVDGQIVQMNPLLDVLRWCIAHIKLHVRIQVNAKTKFK